MLMPSRDQIATAAVAVVIAVGAGCDQSTTQTTAEPTERATPEQPNILIVLADDLGFGDIGAFGSEIETPNIDSLAEAGILFTNFHVGAACSPTRTMLMTGVDNHLAGLGNMLEILADNQFGQPGYEGHLNDSVVTVATLLQDAGYHTYMTGKWHLGHTETTIPYARGFERSFALMESGADNWVQMPYAPVYDAVHYFDDEREVQLPTEGYFSTDFYTDRVIEYIDSGQGDGKPFFAYVAYQAVHYPHQAPREFIDKYDGVYDGGWNEVRRDRLERQKELGIVSGNVTLDSQFTKASFDGWRIPDWDSLSDDERRFQARRMQTYAGMLDNMDLNVGRLLAHLEEIGEAENTLLIFLSDNGADPTELPLALGARPWYETHYPLTYRNDYSGDYSSIGQEGSYSNYSPGWAAAANAPASYYKTFSTEGGIRVPFIARFPGKIPPGQTADGFGFVKDIVPTILEVAGVEPPGTSYNGQAIHPPTGTSMWSVLTGETTTIHPESATLGYEFAGSSAVFRGDYKPVRNLPPKGSGEWELYDMNADPSEVHNLAEQSPELVAELVQAYADYERENGVVPVPEGYNPLEQLVKNIQR